MPDALFFVVAFAAGLAGFGWLALAMDVHWAQADPGRPQGPADVRRLRGLGAVALGVSLAACLAVDHASMAALVWVMTLAAAALATAFALSWRPRWLRVLTVVLARPARAG